MIVEMLKPFEGLHAGEVLICVSPEFWERLQRSGAGRIIPGEFEYPVKVNKQFINLDEQQAKMVTIAATAASFGVLKQLGKL